MVYRPQAQLLRDPHSRRDGDHRGHADHSRAGAGDLSCLAQDRPDRQGFQLSLAPRAAVAGGLSLVLWQVARGLSYQYPKHYGHPHPVARWLLAWVPRMLVAVPLLGAALGLWLSIAVPGGKVELLEDFVDGVNRLRLDFAIAIGTSMVVALLLLIIATAFERRMARRGPDVARKVALFSNWVVFPLIAAGSVVVICTTRSPWRSCWARCRSLRCG